MIVLLGLLGEAGTPVTVVSLAGRRVAGAVRRAGLEMVEKSLTGGPVASAMRKAQSSGFVSQVHRCETAADL